MSIPAHYLGAFCLLCLIGLGSPSRGGAQPVEFDIEIEAPEKLAGLLRNNLSLVRWRGNERLDEIQLQRLFEESRQEAHDLVATEGYYSPRIDAALESRGERWIVRYRIEPNALSHVGEVRLAFEGAIARQKAGLRPDPEDLYRKWALPAGSVFRQADWEVAKRRLLQALHAERYPLARLSGTRAEIDPQAARAALFIVVDSGPQVAFSNVRIEGLSRYPASVVRNLDPTRPGDPYSQARLLEFQRRLQDSGFFEHVEVHALPDADTAVAPVQVTVRENALQRVAFGAGYSTNTGARAQIAYDRLNLLGKAIQFRSALVLETKKQTAQADFSWPVTKSGNRHALSALYKHEDIQNEITDTWGVSARRAWGTERRERALSIDYLHERKSLPHLDDRTTQTLSAGYGFTLRHVDHPLAPNRGYLLNMQTNAGARLGNADPFVRGHVRYAGYFPHGSDFTLIVSAEGGVVAARDRRSIPSDLLFRAGGDQSLRGYAYQSLGVREGGAVVGGRVLALGSIEGIRWIGEKWGRWGAAAFVDFGNAAKTWKDLDPVTGYGVGARWRSPVGIVNLDLAYGEAVQAYRVHFSLGVAF